MTIKQFFGVVEMRTKIISMSTFGMGTMYALYHKEAFDPLIFVIMLISVLFVDMGTTGFNAYFDYKNGTDRIDANSEKNKVILHQGVDERQALTVSIILFVLAGITGIVIAYLTSWYIILVGGACMVVGYTYTGGPYPISRTPLGEIAAGGFLGSVLFVLSYYVQTGVVNWESCLVSLSSSAVVATILTANNTCDLEGDREAGRKTLTILIGRKLSEWVIYLLGCGAYIWAGIMIALGWLPLVMIPFLGFGMVVTIFTYRTMHTIGYAAANKDPIMGNISKVYLVFSMITMLGLAVAVIIS